MTPFKSSRLRQLIATIKVLENSKKDTNHRYQVPEHYGYGPALVRVFRAVKNFDIHVETGTWQDTSPGFLIAGI